MAHIVQFKMFEFVGPNATAHGAGIAFQGVNIDELQALGGVLLSRSRLCNSALPSKVKLGQLAWDDLAAICTACCISGATDERMGVAREVNKSHLRVKQLWYHWYHFLGRGAYK